jgi:uncharacterized repeat protein (TIGR04076 family)
MQDAPFTLYDLEVSIEGDPQTFLCSHRVGYAFSVIGENLTFADNQQFSMYSLAALLAYLPAKQRDTSEHDWLSRTTLIDCPDPACGAQFKVNRIGQTTFRQAAVSADNAA